ncbi:hypothetical protein ACLF3G_28690 [Falsiroseomonas sp. HC035]|uniref:hypothetical protein n=1 Tax=Falsiroseomonas sp. HC035 TaxID=3390999 RepID=UPI003D31D8ED
MSETTKADRGGYTQYRLLLLSSVSAITDPTLPPPHGRAYIYEILQAQGSPPLYVGQTIRTLRQRAYSHISFARWRKGKNRRLEAAICRIIEAREPLVINIHAEVEAGSATDAAETARIAELRARGIPLLNQGPGGERAPVGRLVPLEERLRAAAARRARQRTDDYRRHQSFVASLRRHSPEAYNKLLCAFIERGLKETREALCREQGLPPNALTVIVAGRANDLLVDPAILIRAREVDAMLQKRTADARYRMKTAAAACAAAPPDHTIAQVAAEHGIGGRRLAEAIRRRECGIDQELCATIRARTTEQARRRGRRLGRRARRIDRRQMVWLLTAYSRGAAGLTLKEVGRRLGVTQPQISHVIAGRTAQPLPRQLTKQCRARARFLAGQRGRSLRHLTAEQLCEARRRIGDGESLKKIAADLNVSTSLLNHALRGRSYNKLVSSRA